MLSSRLYSFSTKEFPHQCTESRSHKRCHDKEPELFDSLSAFHQGRSDASCRIHGCPCNRDTHDVNQYQCKSDGQSGQVTSPLLFVRSSQRHQHKDKGKHGFGQKRLSHGIRRKAVGACGRRSSVCTGRYQQRENQRTDNGAYNLKQHIHQSPFRFHASRPIHPV